MESMKPTKPSLAKGQWNRILISCDVDEEEMKIRQFSSAISSGKVIAQDKSGHRHATIYLFFPTKNITTWINNPFA